MTYEEAFEKTMKSRWKTSTCSQGEKCWCRIVEPEEKVSDNQGNEIYLIGSGEVSKEVAEHIVTLHNEYIAAQDAYPKGIFRTNPAEVEE